MSQTLFQRIIDRELPSSVVYEDEELFAFRDINPGAPTHVLLIPKKPIPRIAAATAEDERLLGRMMLKAADIARELGVAESGFRLVINNGPDAGETVPHLHLHILAGRDLSWPPG